MSAAPAGVAGAAQAAVAAIGDRSIEWVGQGLVVVVGATGGLGEGLVSALASRLPDARVLPLSRRGEPAVDLLDEASIADAAAWVKARSQAEGQPLRLVIDASGWLHGQGWMPEKSWRHLDAAHLAHNFAVNAIGPALLMKHFLPLLPRQERAVFATLSAKVGSIGDNRLGGWWGYRAAKAALNQLVKTASVELARSHPQAACVALHPGTVETGLSQPFSHAGVTVLAPLQAAHRLLDVIGGLQAAHTGGFFDHTGEPLPW